MSKSRRLDESQLLNPTAQCACGILTPFLTDGVPQCEECYLTELEELQEAGSRPSAPAPSDDRVEFPSGGPCSACGDGDTEQKYHKHVAPDPSGKPYPKPTDAEVEMARAWIKARGRYLYDAQNWEELGKNYVWNVSYLLAGYHKALTESSPVDLQDAAKLKAQEEILREMAEYLWRQYGTSRHCTANEAREDLIKKADEIAAAAREGR